MLDRQDLAQLRQRLLTEQAQLRSELEGLNHSIYENTLDQQQEGALEMEVATDVGDQEMLLCERDVLNYTMREVERALERLAKGTYGYSEVSGKPIPLERLQAIPWATRLVDEEEPARLEVARA